MTNPRPPPTIPPPVAQNHSATLSLQRVTASIAVAAGLAEANRDVDLAGIDAATGLLCAQIMDLNHTDGHAFRPALIALREKVDALSSTLQSRKT